jgi:hypothetical protein
LPLPISASSPVPQFFQEIPHMRACMFALSVSAAFAAGAASAHGPQIQVTNDDGKIVTRELHLDGPYASAVTAPKSAYVMSVLPFNGTWYSRPNGEIDPITLLPAFPSGPGLAYGSDLADGGPQAFSTGSVLSVGFLAGLKRWNGAAFVDAGDTQLKAFRGSNANITTPPENFGITGDVGPFDSLSLPAVVADYGGEGPEVHNTVRFALLGDGTSPTSESLDGVYSLQLQVSSTQSGLAPSDPYYFVLYKNAPMSHVTAAVSSLGFAASAVQWVTPEPSGIALAAMALFAVSTLHRSSRWYPEQ